MEPADRTYRPPTTNSFLGTVDYHLTWRIPERLTWAIEKISFGRLKPETYARPPVEQLDDPGDRSPDVLYVRSYLSIRTAVGIIGILVPFAFFLGEAYFVPGSVNLRGSISAYYHSSMRDIFVASLSLIAALLMIYMSGQTRTQDFWLSFLAGVALLGVVLFPTWRPDRAPDAPMCGVTPAPTDCSVVQQHLTEATTAHVHAICAAVFIGSLALIALVFADRANRWDPENGRPRARFQVAMAGLILLAVIWVAVGSTVTIGWTLTPLYVGEVVSVWAFGASWFARGRDLRTVLLGAGRPSGSDSMDTSTSVEIS